MIVHMFKKTRIFVAGNTIVTKLALLIVVISGMVQIAVGECQDSVPALAESTFVMAMNRPEDDYAFKWCTLIYTEVFRRLGLKAEIRYFPIKRASLAADEGNVDGEPVRIHEYQSAHPNLIRVEEPVYSANILAYSVNPSIPRLNGWDSLKGTAYRIEYPRGSKICEDNLPRVVKKENLSNVTLASQGLKKLIMGRTDLYVDGDIVTLPLLRTSEFRIPKFDGSAVRVAGKMQSIPLHAYVHKRHGTLAPGIADVIRDMKQEGLITKYRMIIDKEFGIIRE